MGRSCPVTFAGPAGFGPIRLPVRVTQKNDPEKICKQHFVDLIGFDPTYLLQINHKTTRPREKTAASGSGAIITKSCI